MDDQEYRFWLLLGRYMDCSKGDYHRVALLTSALHEMVTRGPGDGVGRFQSYVEMCEQLTQQARD